MRYRSMWLLLLPYRRLLQLHRHGLLPSIRRRPYNRLRRHGVCRLGMPHRTEQRVRMGHVLRLVMLHRHGCMVSMRLLLRRHRRVRHLLRNPCMLSRHIIHLPRRVRTMCRSRLPHCWVRLRSATGLLRGPWPRR